MEVLLDVHGIPEKGRLKVFLSFAWVKCDKTYIDNFKVKPE